MTITYRRDHGGDLDAAIAQYGGARSEWIDLSTGINPRPYPVPKLAETDWAALPDSRAEQALLDAARTFWKVPASMGILAASGASAVIAQAPRLAPASQVRIDGPTYNEHQAAFLSHGWAVNEDTPFARVIVSPNNPDGLFWDGRDIADVTIVDESFCDVAPDQSAVSLGDPRILVLKSFGKFWGLAGLRLGFAIGGGDRIAVLREMLGPWNVSGPALRIGAAALQDQKWANATRARLQADADRLDKMVLRAGAALVGGTTLFRLYEFDDAAAAKERLARAHIWTRTFPYSKTWLRMGLPPEDGWSRLEAAL